MDMFMTEKRILVLGVGNILFTDEGLGVRCIEHMQEKFTFSDNVTLMDGGTLGTKLMGPILESDYLFVCDADGDGKLYDGSTGERIGTISFGATVEASPVVFNDMMIIGSRAGRAYGIKIS